MTIHGFRMPLFFLVSGFFTAMLWRRRGLVALLKQRAKRILLPCLLGLVTVVPVTSIVSAWAIFSTMKLPRSDDGTLAGAARRGDLAAIRQRLDEGADVQAPDTNLGSVRCPGLPCGVTPRWSGCSSTGEPM